MLFPKDEAGPTVTTVFREFLAAIKPLIEIFGSVGCIGNLRRDKGIEFINEEFKNILTKTNIGRELTPVDSVKRSGRAERELALINEGARATWLEFLHHFPDLQFRKKALTWQAIWLEHSSWMNDCINISARVDCKPNMFCPREILYGKRSTSLVLPFMMPGFCHTNRETEMESKRERCF